MTGYDDRQDDWSTLSEQERTTLDKLGTLLICESDPRELFHQFMQVLSNDYPITKGMLALREKTQTRFLAAATFNNGKIRKNLSLLLPTSSSLFERVALDGQMYTENFTQFFDGNTIERNLLLSDDTSAFLLKPLKHDGVVVGLLGFSSTDPDAFVTLGEGMLDYVLDKFAARIANYQPVKI